MGGGAISIIETAALSDEARRMLAGAEIAAETRAAAERLIKAAS